MAPHFNWIALKRPSSRLSSKAKSVFKNLLTRKPRGRPVEAHPIHRELHERATNNRGKIPIDPLRSHPPFGAPPGARDRKSMDSTTTGYSGISEHIWRNNAAPQDEEVIVDRVYSALRSEDSLVLGYF
ncbi:hypothetical protein GGR58DRAFT_480175 [Xylaria digitata]|nr:hypothetical protein GGR58DRAFT_480175 [Xylaria digitata]